MKARYLWIHVILVLSIAQMSFGATSWLAYIHASGEDVQQAVNQDQVVIGIKSQAEVKPSPPAPPDYSVAIDLYSMDFEGPYEKHIQESGSCRYQWIIALNPSGNIMPPATRKATIRWNPSEFGSGGYELREGYEFDGPVVIPNMRLTPYLDVTGGNTQKYFVVVYKPEWNPSLEDVIRILQITSGIEIGDIFCADMNDDLKTGIAEAVYYWSAKLLVWHS